jgi:hypothetical protein
MVVVGTLDALVVPTGSMADGVPGSRAALGVETGRAGRKASGST